MIGRRASLPPVVTGYPLDDIWSVIVPVARTNLVTNPSFETNTTSWTALGGSIARSTAQQYHGAYSLAITPTAATTDGARFDTVSLTSGVLYAFSAKVLGQASLKYKLCIETTGGSELVSTIFTATGRWQWVTGYYLETATTTRRVTLRKNASADTHVFYLDGVQVEALADASERASTYLDGDQTGLVPNQQPPAYYWNGTPHASTSSRSGLTRAGGTVFRFKDYGFLLTAIVGLGLAIPQNVATEYARIDGGYDDYTRKPTRQFTLTGRVSGRNYMDLRSLRSAIGETLDRDLVAQDQRLVLLHHIEDSCGNVQTNESRVLCKYQGGLGGNTDNQIAETIPLTFTQYFPTVLADNEAGASLTVQTSVANAARAIERLPNGTWRALSSTLNNAVNALLYPPDGTLVIAGDFTVPQTRVASWDGTTLSAMGAGLPSSILTLAVGPDGSIYAGGASMTIGGIVGTVAKYSAGAWAIVGATGTMVHEADQMIFGHDGNLYVAGTSALSRATLDKWDGASWTNILTHTAASSAFAIVEGNGGLYIGGVFTNLNADANQDNIAFYNLTTAAWSALGTGLNFGISDQGLALGLDGKLYAIGQFTTAGGVTVGYAASWNGVSWTGMGSGLVTNSLGGVARTLPDGSILMGGSYTTANGITFPDPLARWNGSTFVPLDADLPTDISHPVLGLTTAVDGRLAVGYNFGGTATTAGVTTITNPGTARSYPTVVIKGPSSGTARIWQCVNLTTGRAIYFNLTINSGETATLILQPDNVSFTSDFQGNIASTILPGSNVADFFLTPGANIISFFSASSTVTATLTYRPSYLSLDDIP